MSRPVMVLLLAVALSALRAQPCPAQAPQAPFTERSFVTAIDLVAQVLDSAGKTPADLRPSDFRLLENGVEQRIIGIEYLDPTADPIEPAQAGAVTLQRRPEWQVVIWIDAITTSAPTLTFTARELIKRGPELLKFGRVTLVYSDFSADVLVQATRDEAELTNALNALLKRPGADRVTRVRREFLSALDSVRQMKRKKIEEDGNRMEGPDYITMGIVDSDVPGYIAEEERLIGISRVNLLSALERMPRKLPRMLIYVGDGFDLVPAEFYVRTLETSGASFIDPMKLRTELSKQAERETRELTHRLAVGGWTAVTIGGTTMIAEDATRRTGMRKFDKRSGTAPTFTFLNPADPLIAMAEETGGERVAHAAGLPKALVALGQRIRITYQVDREPDPEPRKVELVALRPGLTIRAPGWTSSTTAEGVAEGRAIESLRKEAGPSDIPVTARLLPPSDGSPLPTLEVRADFSPARTSFANIGATKLRFTIAVEAPGGLPAPIVHQIATVENLAALRGFVWKSPMKMPDNVSAIAVVAEELITGLWGATRFTPGGPRVTEPAAAPRVAAASPPEPLAPQDADEAFARAAAERKLVVAFETNDGWEGCTLDCGLLENRATSHPEIQRLLGSFVVVETPQTALPPRIAMYDPSRRLLLSWSAAFSSVADRRRPFSTGELAEMLKRATEASPHALRAHELASAGRMSESQMALGTAFRAARQADRAEAAWTEAARLAAAAGDRAAQQTAEVLSANMAATQGRAAEALIRLREIAAAPASPANEAEALLVIAQIQRTAGDEKSAMAALSRALAVAPVGSESYRLAALLSKDEPGTRRVASPGAGRPLQLVVSGRAPFSGRTRLQVIVQDPTVSSVTFTPDEGRAITDSSPPFEATIDLGPVPRMFEIHAVARDSANRTVGEDALTLNERHDQFWIRVRMDMAAAEARAEMSIPEGARLSTLRFFADGAPLEAAPGNELAARFSPKVEPSVIRAVATLKDGRTAEDAILVGEAGYTENIEARDVEIYATVLDGNGEPIRGLDRSQFSLTEKGVTKRIRSFETLERAPFSIGLAVDSSSSMNDVMPDVHRTARTFLARAVADGSSAFVIDFDEAPRLAAARTTDIPTLDAAIGGIRADRSTALYDSIIFGLLQLQGIHGKRALIVLTDGRDETSRYSLEDAVAVARESSVAIYAIILAPRPRPEDVKLDPQIEKIAVETGGRAWYLPESANMDAIYRAIDLELRNQYRLTYRTTPGKGASDWRAVKVTVDVAGATVRTAAGFVAR